MRVEIKRVNVWSAARVGLMIHLILSLIVVLPAWLCGVAARMNTGPVSPEVAAVMQAFGYSQVLCGVALIALHTLFAAIIYALAALLYNLVAWLVGGFELKLRRIRVTVAVDDEQPVQPEHSARSTIAELTERQRIQRSIDAANANRKRKQF